MKTEEQLSGFADRCCNMEDRSVAWGGYVDPACSYAYGARTILNQDHLDFLPDRHSGIVEFEANSIDRDNLESFLIGNPEYADGWGKANRKMSSLIGAMTVWGSDSDRFWLRFKRFVIMGSPNASYGYFYLKAWIMPTEDLAPLTEDIVDLYGEALKDNYQGWQYERVLLGEDSQINGVDHGVADFTVDGKLQQITYADGSTWFDPEDLPDFA